MERRDFLKIGAGGAAKAWPAGALTLSVALAAPVRPDLAVAHGANPRTTRAAVDAMGGMKAFISRGDVVVIKPNIGWDRTPEQAADTNPAVVATLILMCLEAGGQDGEGLRPAVQRSPPGATCRAASKPRPKRRERK